MIIVLDSKNRVITDHITVKKDKAEAIYKLIGQINRKERNSVRESSSTPEP